MHISYQPLWNTLKKHGMRKENLRFTTDLITNMIANMGKGKHIDMATLLRICETLDCDITDVIKLVEEFTAKDRRSFLETQMKFDQNIMVDILRRATQ